MKKLILFLFITGTINLHAQYSMPQVSAFLNLGQSIPVGSYSSSSSTFNPVAMGKASPFVSSFNLGVDGYVFPNWGLSLGISVSGFDLDKKAFEKAHIDNPQYSDSYLRNHSSLRLYGGLTYRFSFNSLSLEPRVNIGLTSFNFEFADFYEVNEDGEIFRTISYDYGTPSFLSLNGGLNLTYDWVEIEGMSIGLQFFSELSYQKPEVKYEKTVSDKYAGTNNTVEESFRQNIMFVYYGFGLVLKE